MLLIIHNLPDNMSIASIKKLIKDNCGAEEVILDNLINEGHGKRVTVGLVDETDAALLVRKINGLFLGSHQLFVEDVRQKKLADQPYRPQKVTVPNPSKSKPLNQHHQFENSSSMQIPQMIVPPAYSNMPFYMTPVQNPYVTPDKETVVNPLPQVPFYQQDLSFGYQQLENQNRWIDQPAVSYPDKKVLLSNSDAKAERKSYHRDRKQDFSMERRSNLRDRRESPPRRGEDRRRRDKYNKRYNEPDPRRDVRRSLSRERERQSRKPGSRNDEFKKSNRYKIERSPPRDRRFNRDDVDRGRVSSDDRRGRAPKRHRDFNSRERVVNSHEENYDFGKPNYYTENRDYDDGNRNPAQDEYYFQVNEEHSGFNMPANREEHDNFMYEQTYQESDFEINRSYSGQIETNPTTFSSNPHNSTFTNFNPDTYTQTSTDFNAPPSKMARFSNLNVDKSGIIHPATTVSNDNTFANKSLEKPFVIPLKPRVHQHSNFFARAAGVIAADMMKKAKVGHLQNYTVVYQHLKKCIESRIDVIMQDNVPNTLKEVIRFYRYTFPFGDDPQFLEAVLEKTQRDMAEPQHPNPGDSSVSEDDFHNNDMSFVTANKNRGVSANQQPQGFKKGNYKAGQGSNKFQPNKMPKLFGKKKPNPPANVPVQQEQSNRLPRSKQVFKEQKKLSKMEYMIEDMYNLDPTLLGALNHELRKLCEAYLMGSSQPANDEDEEKFRLILRKRTPYTFKKVMRIHLSKRLLNVADNLVIRIFANPKNPKRDDLDQFLKEKGITYVKKSDTKRMFLAMAPSYEVYDDLLAMQHFMIGDCSLHFKPLHLIGPPAKKHFKKKNQQTEVEEDDDESGDDEELERLIAETENKVNEQTENVEQFAGTVVEILDDDDVKLVPGGPQAGGVATNDDYTIDIDVVMDKTNNIVVFEDDKNIIPNSEDKKEIKDEEAHETCLDTKVITEDNNKADKVQVDDSKIEAEIHIKSDDNTKENIEIINKEADDPEKGNAINNESDEVTVADSAEVDEENLCAVDVDDDDLEDF